MSQYYTEVFNRFQPKIIPFSGAEDMLKKDFDKNNLLICGESHGVRENADLAYTLCKILNIKQLAIERSCTNFEKFIHSAIEGKPDFLVPQVLQSLQASVLSTEMLKTIVLLYNSKLITDIKFVDIDPKRDANLMNLNAQKLMQARERKIAENILSLNPKIPTMTILGNFHTRLTKNSKIGTSSLVKVRESRGATYIRYRYLAGSQYNAGRELHFTENSINESFKVKNKYEIVNLNDSNFEIMVPKAHTIST